MIRISHLVFPQKDYLIVMNNENDFAREILGKLPITSEAQNIGGEIYFRVPEIDIKYDGSEREEFEIGDVVYWRSPIGENKFAIALFYGNTQYSNYKTPRASSPCVKIGKLIEGFEGMETIKTGENVKLIEKQILIHTM